jgi:hypothetical protein
MAAYRIGRVLLSCGSAQLSKVVGEALQLRALTSALLRDAPPANHHAEIQCHSRLLRARVASLSTQ